MARSTRGREPDPTPSPDFPPAFVRAVNAAIRRIGWQVQSWQSDGVECLDGEGEKASFGLDNLYRRVKDLERAEWADAIAEHLRRVSAALREKPSETDLNEVADRLLLRVGKPFGEGLPGPHPWSHALEGTDLVVNVVIDYPETMAYVTPEMIGRSGKPGGHWLEMALDNLRQMTTPDQLDLIDEETGILLCSTGDSYDAARALVLERLIPEAQEAGCLVALPNRERLFVLPVRLEAVPHLHVLKFIAQRSHAEAPYPISDEVYWVRDDVWRPFPIEIKDKSVTVRPPEAFIDVLNALAGEGGAEEDE